MILVVSHLIRQKATVALSRMDFGIPTQTSGLILVTTSVDNNGKQTTFGVTQQLNQGFQLR